MASFDKDTLFDNLAIRDTAEHESAHSYIGEFTAETLVFYNGLNQEVSLQYQGSVDDINWINIGTPLVVAVGDRDYETVTDFFPEYRVIAQCSIAPSSGELSMCLLKARG